MDAKKLLKKHLDLHIPKGKYMSEKQLVQARYDAAIDAINEALSLTPVKEDFDFNKSWKELLTELMATDFGGHKLLVDTMAGSVYLDFGDRGQVYCTPFWEYESSLPKEEIGINVQLAIDDFDGDESVIQYPHPTNQEEFLKFKDFYIFQLFNLKNTYK